MTSFGDREARRHSRCYVERLHRAKAGEAAALGRRSRTSVRYAGWERVGLRGDLLRRWENGPVFRSFSSNSDGYTSLNNKRKTVDTALFRTLRATLVPRARAGNTPLTRPEDELCYNDREFTHSRGYP